MIFFTTLFITLVGYTLACTNLLINKGASSDGSNVIAYNADASNFYTTIYHYPATSGNTNTTMRKMWSWDYATYLGEIPEAEETYNVVGNVNEYGVIIGESTFGGLMELACNRNTGLVDYGSLIWVTLQRVKTAREAIDMMNYLVTEYGYASTGESFSIADPNEIWVLELIGKGRHAKGAVWVARRIPDGYVSGHANQARITTFPLDDPENCRYSPDVVSFAREIGLYPADPAEAPDSAFSFSDTYDPVTFSGARFCEARVWSFFSTVMGEEWSAQYLDYAQGYNLTNRMPLWVKPQKPVDPSADTIQLSVADVTQAMRNHYEGTELDNTGKLFPDVGAGAFSLPNRNSPISWTSKVNSDSREPQQYFNERTIAQPPTGWSIVMQARPNVPRQMAAVEWFGMDDSSTAVHFPLYGSNTRIAAGWAGPGPQDGATPPLMTFSLQSAFYVFNLVANFAYSRWDLIYADVYDKILEKEARYRELAVQREATALEYFNAGDVTAGVEHLTDFSVSIGDALLLEWFEFFGQLFVKFRDGYVTTANKKNPVCGCSTNSAGYQQQWYDYIAADTGDRYLYPDGAEDSDGDIGFRSTTTTSAFTHHSRRSIPKMELRAFN